MSSSNWQPVIDQMFEELRVGEPRAEVYWAQQLAFSPVYFFAIVVAVRNNTIPSNDLQLLRQVVPLALALLGALPEGSGGDPNRLRSLAHRQAFALGLGRRHHLRRLASRLGLEVELSYDPVPSKLLGSYEVIGWRPPVQATQTCSPSQRSNSEAGNF